MIITKADTLRDVLDVGFV